MIEKNFDFQSEIAQIVSHNIEEFFLFRSSIPQILDHFVRLNLLNTISNTSDYKKSPIIYLISLSAFRVVAELIIANMKDIIIPQDKIKGKKSHIEAILEEEFRR